VGEIEQSEAGTAELGVPPAVAECKHCQSQNLIREGWYRSKLLEEQGQRRQIVRCGSCNRFTYLAVGAVLPTKHQASGERLRRQIATRTVIYEQTKDVTDIRPNCPRCGGSKIQRHRKMKDGKRCWECVDCRRSFVAEDSPALVDHRRISHFEEISAEEEARFFYHYALRTGTIEDLRRDIGYSESEKKCLEFLAANGMLANTNIAPMLKFRDDVLQKFNSLVDAELAVAAERELEPKSLRDYSLSPRPGETTGNKGEADADTDLVDVESASLFKVRP
jgi:hypothetical protein